MSESGEVRKLHGLEAVLAAAQHLTEEETKILQAALAWDVEDVETAKQRMEESEASQVWPEGSPERRLIELRSAEARERAAAMPPDGWQGTPPAEGTRRKLILDTLEDLSLRLISGQGGKPTSGSCLEAADAIEEALLGASFRHDESSQTLKPPPIHYLLDSAEIPRTAVAPGQGGAQRSLSLSERVELLIRDHAARKVTIDGLAATVDEQNRQLSTGGRDDGWVSEVAYQVAGAATRPLMEDHPDYVFPAERVSDAVAELLKDFGIARACRDCAEEQLGHGAKEVDGRRDATIKGLQDDNARLLGEREEARSGEGRFAEERDCAFALLRWLLPVTVAKRLDGGDPAVSLADALGGIEDRLSEINAAVRD